MRDELADRRYARAQHVHRPRVSRDLAQDREEPVGHEPPRREPGAQVGQLAFRRQVSEQQQVRDLFERRVLREVMDVVAAIGEPPRLALDVAEHGLADDDAFETGIDHRGRHDPIGFSPPRVSPTRRDAAGNKRDFCRKWLVRPSILPAFEGGLHWLVGSSTAVRSSTLAGAGTAAALGFPGLRAPHRRGCGQPEDRPGRAARPASTPARPRTRSTGSRWPPTPGTSAAA